MKQLLVTLNILISVTLAYGQEAAKLVRIIPPSPTAYALAKYQEIPVSKYTGVPNIGIPINEITVQDITVPIALQYHAGGIRPSEESSWVGLGWSLLCGGMITREVRGLDDLPTNSSVFGYPDTYMPTSIDPSTNLYIIPGDPAQKQDDEEFLIDVLGGQADVEPDVFVFNFNGRTGKFLLDKRSNTSEPFKPILISQEDLKIEVAYSSATSNYQWTITDERGMKFIFGTVEKITSRSGMGEDEWTADTNAPEGSPSNVVSAWYLDKIVSPLGAEIHFSYQTIAGSGTKRMLSRSQIKKHVIDLHAQPGCLIPMNEYICFSNYSEIRNVYLKTISFANGKIEFLTSNRSDIAPADMGNPSYAKKLDGIQIYSGTPGSYNLLKEHLFSYGYFNSTGGVSSKRLKLVSLTERAGASVLPPHLFAYNTEDLPEKDSKSIDHWGYYNGASNHLVTDPVFGSAITQGGTLIPPMSLYNFGTGQIEAYVGADREPNFDYASASVLTNITYPTGGNTSFEYELNKYFQPKEIIEEQGHEVYITKFGSATGIPNVRPDTITIHMSQPGDLKVFTSLKCHDNTCIAPGGEWEYDVARIQSVGNTPNFDRWIGFTMTYENQEEGDEQETILNLPAGDYKLTVFAGSNLEGGLRATWISKEPVMTYNQPGGGLRIKRITSSTGANNVNEQITDYKYTRLAGGLVRSTGLLMSPLVYYHEEGTRKGCELSYLSTSANSIVRSSGSFIPISSSALGNVIGYSMVTESRENFGKKVYEYLNEQDDLDSPLLPGVPTNGYIGNGLLIKTASYSTQHDGSYKLQQELENEYKVVQGSAYSLKGMKVPSADAALIISDDGVIPIYINVKFYDLYSERIQLVSTRKKTYSQSDTGSVESKSTYKYQNPNWWQVTEIVTEDSRGLKRSINYKYPFDFPSDAVLTEMVNRHQIKKIVEESHTIENNHVKTVKTNYSQWPNGIILPSTVDIKIGGSAFETRLRNHAYSTTGRLLSQSRENDKRHSFQWGYNDQYPTVEAINARPDEIYYESFEEGSTGLVHNASKTGAKVHGSGFTVQFVRPNQRKYILSYWYKNSLNGDWIYKSRPYTANSYTISDGLYIDEVRIHPIDASMRTFTYLPLIGQTSVTDASGLTTYYDYDLFQRLKEVRNNNGMLLERYEYNYQTP